MERVGQIRHPEGTASRTAYGRRVTSKTFTILGASTPENRISTKGASRKQKVIAAPKNFKTSAGSVFNMHNGSSHHCGLILGAARLYVQGNAFGKRDLDRANETTT